MRESGDNLPCEDEWEQVDEVSTKCNIEPATMVDIKAKEVLAATLGIAMANCDPSGKSE